MKAPTFIVILPNFILDLTKLPINVFYLCCLYFSGTILNKSEIARALEVHERNRLRIIKYC